MSHDFHVRAARPDDLDALVELCREHAEYERAPFVEPGARERLATCLFAQHARLRAFVAESAGRVVGYATWTREASTWHGRDHAYFDCLYVLPEARASGIGTALMRTVGTDCARAGLDAIEWQTPAWNARASVICPSMPRHPIPA